MEQIQVSIVTPETTTFDSPADSVVVPLMDGQKGIFPSHAAMIGRLGPGELRVNSNGASESFYIDGGFVQITGSSVSVLTGRSIPVSEIDIEKAKADLEAAKARKADKPELMDLKQKAISQAAAQIRLAENA